MTKETVFLTGASGFLALHIVDQLLEANYNIVATVRNEARTVDVKKLAEKHSREVVFEYVPDIVVPGAFDEALSKHKSVTKVIHTAAQVGSKGGDPIREIVEPSVKGTVNLLDSIAKHAPQVDKVVFTSSFAAVLSFSTRFDSKATFTEESWNDVTEDYVEKHPEGAYALGKTRAEKSLWDFVKNEKPNFTATSVNPPYFWGPILGSVKNVEELNLSSLLLYKLLTGKAPPTLVYNFADVRDVAAAHVLALTSKASDGKRWLITAGQAFPEDMITYAKEAIPEYAKVAPAVEGLDRAEIRARTSNIDDSVSRKEAGIKYRPLKEVVVDSARDFLALGGFKE